MVDKIADYERCPRDANTVAECFAGSVNRNYDNGKVRPGIRLLKAVGAALTRCASAKCLT